MSDHLLSASPCLSVVQLFIYIPLLLQIHPNNASLWNLQLHVVTEIIHTILFSRTTGPMSSLQTLQKHWVKSIIGTQGTDRLKIKIKMAKTH